MLICIKINAFKRGIVISSEKTTWLDSSAQLLIYNEEGGCFGGLEAEPQRSQTCIFLQK